MNDTGKNQGQPRNQGQPKNQGQPRNPAKRNQPKPSQPKHGGRMHGTEKPPVKLQRDTSTLGVRTDETQKEPLVTMDCAICGKPIFDLSGALADRDTSTPVHFDCAFERLTAAEPLEAGEKLVYLGAGCFGVVAFKNGQEGAFVVKRRIRWEKEGEKQAWRKDISSYITRI
jgi:hypothetical protein